jgi:hypothetical protein
VVPKPPDEEPAGDTDDKDDKGGKDVVPLHIAAAE